ncbi:MAG: hypothetical protein ACK55C_00380, partial [bacterium]
ALRWGVADAHGGQTWRLFAHNRSLHDATSGEEVGSGGIKCARDKTQWAAPKAARDALGCGGLRNTNLS